MPRLPILTFHAIEEEPSLLSFGVAALREGLDRIVARGWRSIDLLDVATCLASGRPLPARRFAISFDDGYRTVYERALPELVARELTATVFVTTGDGSARSRLPSLSGREMLSWNELAEMTRLGIAVGAHTLTHPDLTTQPPATARAEMEGSRALLEDRLGVAVRAFAYPFGRYDATSRALARELFDCGCSDRLGRVGAASDRFAMPRVETYYLRTAGRLALVASPLLALALSLRAGPRRMRRWVAHAFRANAPHA